MKKLLTCFAAVSATVATVAATPVSATATASGAARASPAESVRLTRTQLPNPSDNQGSLGSSVAVSGTTILIGTSFDMGNWGQGAYVFEKGAHGWREASELGPSDPDGSVCFGSSVAISGDTAVVSDPCDLFAGNENDPGLVYIYTRGTSGWGESAVLSAPPGAPDAFDDGSDYDFGYSLAISGNTIAVGAPASGEVYLYNHGIKGWRHTANFSGPPGDANPTNVDGLAFGFGLSLALSDNTLVVGGAPEGAYVFVGGPHGWHQSAILMGSGEGRNVGSGSVAMWGNTVVLGASRAEQLAGRAYVFQRQASGWKQVAVLAGPGVQPYDEFASAVAMSANMIAVSSALGPLGGNQVFVVFLFIRGPQGWRQVSMLRDPNASNSEDTDVFGTSIAMSTQWVVAGDASSGTSGSTYVFQYQLTSTPTSVSPTVIAEAKASGEPADASAEGEANVFPIEAVITSTPSQVADLTWSLNCEDANGNINSVDGGSSISLPIVYHMKAPSGSLDCDVFVDVTVLGDASLNLKIED